MSKIFKFANVYFGKNSVVKLFANKTHIQTNTDYDAKAINSCNIIINAPMNAIISNTDAKVLTAVAE